MTYSPPGNPVKQRASRVRNFDGVNGPEYKVLRRTNERGWDLSNHVANICEDFNLGRKGTMLSREGTRKVNDTGKSTTIEGILSMALVGNAAYALIYNSTMEVITMPRLTGPRLSPIELTPAKSFGTFSNSAVTTWPGELS